MPIVTSNGIDMYYEVHGEGESLLLIGGLSNDVTDYERSGIIEMLAKDFKVIAFDNRGAGRTDKPDVPYSIGMMADDAAGLLRALGIARSHIVAVSMGGRIALDLALRHPEMVNKLVLVSTGPRTARSWRRQLLFAFARFTPGYLKGKYPQPQYAFKRQREASSNYDCTDRLHEIRKQTLVVHGKSDHIAPYAIAKEMHQKIRDSKIISFNGGHVFFFFQPRKFVDAVMEFLKT